MKKQTLNSLTRLRAGNTVYFLGIKDGQIFPCRMRIVRCPRRLPEEHTAFYDVFLNGHSTQVLCRAGSNCAMLKNKNGTVIVIEVNSSKKRTSTHFSQLMSAITEVALMEGVSE